ncbi:hypothetical protein [Bradyrhizobium sp. B117]|uniref:hypothetical protein n=1 Tax=Bradyrhizobium sp. B117 TaxID=3140246 RepID=UPI003183175E
MWKHRFKPSDIHWEHLWENAMRLRKEAECKTPGIERERLLRLARQAEIGAEMSQWLRSPGPRPPK